jgi:hypothetical protein
MFFRGFVIGRLAGKPDQPALAVVKRHFARWIAAFSDHNHSCGQAMHFFAH